ncbi:hypothetical protein [Escherichia coli]|uniref:hypothetical protein n=1 Tax=Escherichia coli TaxID=562 RepID=UPI003F1B4786
MNIAFVDLLNATVKRWEASASGNDSKFAVVLIRGLRSVAAIHSGCGHAVSLQSDFDRG